MDTSVPITDTVHWVGVNDRETSLFEALWPLPYGIAYNSYLILDEKVALIDTVKETSIELYIEKLRSLLPEGKGVDYLIINHMEPDHSGSIRILRELYPEMTIIGNKQTNRFLNEFFGITENVETVAADDTLSLGTHVLQFVMTPMLHWPETMMAYDTSEKILFSGDAFGAFGALSGGVCDDEIDAVAYEDEILRYFANIVGKYSRMVQRAMKSLESVDVNIVAATHGPVWRRRPRTIIDYYDRWSRHEAENGVVIAYGSMYGNTTRMAEAVARGLRDGGAQKVIMHDVATCHPSYIIRDVWRYKGIALGAPAYDQGLFPAMAPVTEFLAHKGLMGRYAAVFGSYGWSGGTVKALDEFVENVGWKSAGNSVEIKCSAGKDDLYRCRKLGENLAEQTNQ